MANVGAASVVGWYDFSWSGGSFLVCLRPGGHFYAPGYGAASKWSMSDDNVKIDWGSFGKYEMKFSADTRSMEGAVAGSTKEGDWRKAAFNRELSPVELALLGEGAGTEWQLEWMEGKFAVQFKADGYNHFSCQKHPAHSHWKLNDDGTTVRISWGEFGEYELAVDPEKKTMEGGAVKGGPNDWRKATFLRDLNLGVVDEKCDHHHD